MKSHALPKLLLATLLWAPLTAYAYLPEDCDEQRARVDFQKADLVLIGRVVKIEREVMPRPRPNMAFEVRYIATLKAGQVYRPQGAPMGGEYRIVIGSYAMQAEDDTLPTSIQTHMTHPRVPLRIDGVYLIALNKVKKGIGGPFWAPRSCHGSIHSLGTGVVEGPGGGARVTLVQRGLAFKRKRRDDEAEHHELQEFLDLHGLKED